MSNKKEETVSQTASSSSLSPSTLSHSPPTSSVTTAAAVPEEKKLLSEKSVVCYLSVQMSWGLVDSTCNTTAAKKQSATLVLSSAIVRETESGQVHAHQKAIAFNSDDVPELITSGFTSFRSFVEHTCEGCPRLVVLEDTEQQREDWANFSDLFRRTLGHKPFFEPRVAFSAKDLAPTVQYFRPRDAMSAFPEEIRQKLLCKTIADMAITPTLWQRSLFFAYYGQTVELFTRLQRDDFWKPRSKGKLDEWGREKQQKVPAFKKKMREAVRSMKSPDGLQAAKMEDRARDLFFHKMRQLLFNGATFYPLGTKFKCPSATLSQPPKTILDSMRVIDWSSVEFGLGVEDGPDGEDALID